MKPPMQTPSMMIWLRFGRAPGRAMEPRCSHWHLVIRGMSKTPLLCHLHAFCASVMFLWIIKVHY